MFDFSFSRKINEIILRKLKMEIKKLKQKKYDLFIHVVLVYGRNERKNLPF